MILREVVVFFGVMLVLALAIIMRRFIRWRFGVQRFRLKGGGGATLVRFGGKLSGSIGLRRFFLLLSDQDTRASYFRARALLDSVVNVLLLSLFIRICFLKLILCPKLKILINSFFEEAHALIQ